MRARILTLCGVVSLTASGSALAQGHDPATAVELFRRGRAALEAGDYAAACPTLAESLRLEAHVGTAISLAQCEQATRRFASASAHWQLAADLARGLKDRREAFARRALETLGPYVPLLTLTLPANVGADVIIQRDDVVLGAASVGVPLPVEIGAHTITTTIAGHQPSSITLTLAEGERRELLLQPGPLLREAPAGAAPAPPAAPGSATSFGPPAEQAPPSPPPAQAGTPALVWVAGSVGLAALATGAVGGGLALADYGQASTACPQRQGCSDTALADRSHAETAAWVANVGVTVGIVGVVLAAYSLFTTPRSAGALVRTTARGVELDF